jgi:hypothetical protein
MTKLISLTGTMFVLFIGVATLADAYDWYTYDGNSYALTSDWSNWTEAEAEAVSLGGHLVTVNDDNENTWLMNTFRDTYVRSYPGYPWQNTAWIGYYSNDGGSSWQWISGEPVTYYRHDFPGWPMGGTHAYLHLANHPYPATWDANLPHDTDYDYNPKGIVEVAAPTAIEPTSWGRIKSTFHHGDTR